MADEADHWRQWLRRHGPALLLFARQWSSSHADAEDAVQNGFLKFWKNRRRGRDQVGYFYACVRSAAMDMGRAQRRRRSRELAGRSAEPSAFQPQPQRAERAAQIEAALSRLPGDQREVVVMKIWGELTFAQIGQILDVPLATAASRYRLALARLAADLAEQVAHD